MNQHRLHFAHILAACAVLLFVTAAAGAQAPTPATAPATPAAVWKTFSYSNEGFSITFLGEPKSDKQNVSTAVGNIELRTYISEPGSTAFYVGVADYGSAATGRDPQQVLEGAQSGAISNINGHLVRDKKILLGIYPGKEYVAESDSMHIEARIYLVGSVLYQTLAGWPLKESDPGSQRFMDSFQLIPRGTN